MWSFTYIIGRLYSFVLSIFSPTHRSNKWTEGRKESDDRVVEKKESNEELSHPDIGDKSHSKILYFVVGSLLIVITYSLFDSDKVVSHLQKRELTTLSSVYGGDCFEDKDIDDCRVRAEQGDSSAQYNLGLAYQKGLGVPQDYKESVKWYRKSAEQGYAEAQSNLGNMYERGQGVLQDYKESVKWTRKAAEQGDSFAQYNLGIMYSFGRGVLQDYKESVKWYRKAAEQRFAEAQYNLGVMYDKGQGVLQDYVMAHMYWNIASVSGHKGAIYNRDLIAKEMTSSQLEKAQDLAREWMRTHHQ